MTLMSMTGYGQAESHVEGVGESPAYTVRVELRVVNNRFLSMRTRLPEGAGALMPAVEKALRERLARGTVHLSVELRLDASDPRGLVDTELLESYMLSLREIARRRGWGEASLDTLLVLPGVIRAEGAVPAKAQELEKSVLATLSQAIDELIEMRLAEGEHLAGAIEEALAEVEGSVALVRAGAHKVMESYRERLRKRVNGVLEKEGITLDNRDIAREVVFFADRSDITEELSRLESHISQMRRLLEEGVAVGKRMEFVTQEMFREANTILAKVNDPELGEQALPVKSGVEKIKEQVLNVE